MAKKYLKVEVTKILGTDLYIEVDDKDERFKDIFTQIEMRPRMLAFGKATKAIEPFLNKAVKDTVDSSDWQDSGYEIECVSTCEEEEATQYACFTMPPNVG